MLNWSLTCLKPFFEIINFCVNPRFSSFATSTSMGNDSNQSCCSINWADQWASRITLTSIFSRCCDKVIFCISWLLWIVGKTSTKLIIMQYKFFVIRIITWNDQFKVAVSFATLAVKTARGFIAKPGGNSWHSWVLRSKYECLDSRKDLTWGITYGKSKMKQ